jgi:hypothetical protein
MTHFHDTGPADWCKHQVVLRAFKELFWLSPSYAISIPTVFTYDRREPGRIGVSR